MASAMSTRSQTEKAARLEKEAPELLASLKQLIEKEGRHSCFAVGSSIPIKVFDVDFICDSDEVKSNTDEAPEVELGKANQGEAGDPAGAIHDDRKETKNAKDTSSTPLVIRKKDVPKQHLLNEPDNHHRVKCDPVVIRYTSPKDGSMSCITLPPGDLDRPLVEQFAKDCEPAKFGRGGQDVYDEDYRKAGKLDESAFSSNFNPYTLGIIDSIKRVLLPGIMTKRAPNVDIRAELYKLNVYSAPSGKFKAHVDTPRSSKQFGSLVVCLPCEHKGGQLLVRHAGREATFDWSTAERAKFINWAAFYSDCEHEILQVTKGHRLTLTYNLFVSCSEQELQARPQTSALHECVQALQSNSYSFKPGQIFGIHCSHAYPFTYDGTEAFVPSMLKGVDKMVYESFVNANLKIHLRPVLHRRDMRGQEMYEKYEKKPHRLGDPVFIGRQMQPLKWSNDGMWYDGEPLECVEKWGKWRRVTWLNQSKHYQPAIIHGTYGNEAGLECQYSSLAMFIMDPECDDSDL